ncbi:MAG TPA: hypothetical protein DEG88_02000 [Propionibacteriaceae bacterium]|nr:hypothetical protein [Propionibacteriaceae bacterium]HBY22101.1 hypothetical protein [Propionibacteriaceae bacterium]
MQREIRRRGRAFGPTTPRFGSARRRVVPQPLSQGVCGEGESVAAIVEVHQEAKPVDDFPSGDFGVSEHERLHHDVPLMVEGLLLQAGMMVDSGAPTKAVEAILDHVAALREGRD